MITNFVKIMDGNMKIVGDRRVFASSGQRNEKVVVHGTTKKGDPYLEAYGWRIEIKENKIHWRGKKWEKYSRPLENGFLRITSQLVEDVFVPVRWFFTSYEKEGEEVKNLE